ncbi:MAG: Hsp70 family protein, partial [Lachnospiraceae bacterium]|nr:Hsp70 family protein [Lachnospiraceae bacterium]
VHVLQGEREMAAGNKTLGRFTLSGLAPAPRGVPQIEVTFNIDRNGIVNVSAKDLGTGKEQHITITGGSNMSDADIDKAIKEAQEFEAQDKKRKEAIDSRNDADSMVFQTEKALKEVGDKIDPAAKSTVEADIAELKTVLDRTKDQSDISDADIDALKSGKEKLMNDAQQLFAQMYNQAQGAQGGPAPDMNMGGGAQSGPKADDVVDGDYREV